MKIAPLHFKINYLAIQQHELINYGNKFATEIYAMAPRAPTAREAGALVAPTPPRSFVGALNPCRRLDPGVSRPLGSVLVLFKTDSAGGSCTGVLSRAGSTAGLITPGPRPAHATAPE